MILDPDDCGWVSEPLTVLDNRPEVQAKDTCVTRRFLAYIQRKAPPTNDMLLCEDFGDHLGPPLGRLPGDKESIVQLSCMPGAIVVTYLGRGEGAPSDAPFALRREVIEVPGIYPIEMAALFRIRNIAKLLAVADVRFALYAR